MTSRPVAGGQARALEGLLGALRGCRAPKAERPLADLPWPEQLALLRAARAPVPATPPTTTTVPMIYNRQAVLAWLEKTTAALGREPSTREILVHVLGGTPSQGDLGAFTRALREAGAVQRRSSKGRREPVWRTAHRGL